MEGISWIVIDASALLAAVAAMLLVPVLVDGFSGLQRTVRIRSRLIEGGQGEQVGETSGGSEGRGRFWELLFTDLCTNGVKLCRLPVRYLGKITAFRRLVQSVQAVLSTRIRGCNSRAIAEALFTLCVLCGLVFYLLTSQILLALVGMVLPLMLINFKVSRMLRERRDRLREQLPDALRGLSMCFMAGLSLEQAFDQTARECREPLNRELRRVVDDLHTGSTIQESLSRLDARLVIDDMRFVAVALEIQHRTGGSMREVLDSAADSMLASFDLSRSLEVQTSQARMSARIVSMLPVVLVLVLSVAMKGYLATFFSSAAGLTLLVCAVGMELAGILIIRKILGIDLK